MPLDSEKFDNILPNRNTKTACFVGLKDFVQSLEKHFFSKITVRDNSSNVHQINLVIELECNLTLFEMLLHSDKGNWGAFNQSRYSLDAEIEVLEEKNKVSIDVDEFSIILKDTNIVIDKIYNRSISNQLDSIFNELNKHQFQLTKGNSEVPYEIFVAVFEEDLLQSVQLDVPKTKKTQNYSSFWALYFDSEEDAVIYDLKKSRIIYEDLYMLNQ
ncbi:hypothetical protein [Maribacter sp. HTCC2170]|uniref:hypothetical protein n=1 Tax=Maribacter sp. (strain HTCC2170 / KCCM 42371) TaxID=313603 RepID=UPI00006B2211|nr:hypothetical protein [Maribacter sp. HTCC2170]EAR00387.1 serine hydroxymethyltransferase [Maribacter sp. HTCC2170]